MARRDGGGFPNLEASLKLFLDTARRVQSDFDVANGDVEALVRICRPLEGMPLGAERSNDRCIDVLVRQ